MVDTVVSGTGQRGGPAFENRDIRAMVELLQPQKAVIQLESLWQVVLLYVIEIQ
jgi:hypothetical protein